MRGGGTNGTYELNVPGVTDARRQGIVFVTGGKNEDNFASSGAAHDGSAYRLATKDNGSNADSYERDPIAFAFIPTGTPGVVMGKVSGQGIAVLESGNFTVAPVLSTSPNDNNPDGIYRLDIAGHTPASGTLLLSPENSFEGGNSDNIVTAEPASDGQGWIINSRDLPGDPQPNLQAVFNQVSFNFAFFPNDGSASGPGAIKPLSEFQWDSTLSSVVGANVDVTENDPLNQTGSNNAIVSSGTPGIIVPSVNKADIGLAMGGDYFREPDGVMFASVTENRNSPGDLTSNGGAVNPNTSLAGGAWMVHTQMANGDTSTPGFNTETNVDFATAFFQTNSGFQIGGNQPYGDGVLEPGVDITVNDPNNLVNEGILIVGGYGNDDNYATVSVETDEFGDFWSIDLRDNGGNPEPDNINYVWLPFNDPDVVAGRIGSSGGVIASSNDGGADDFSISNIGAGTYELTIPGVTPDDGMLLMNGALGGFGGSIMSYEDSGNGTFIIQTLQVTGENAYAIADHEFQFAFVDFGIPAVTPVIGDYNGDGVVNTADYTTYRDNIGGDAAALFAQGTRDPATNGPIGPDDYSSWKSRFGNTAAAGSLPAFSSAAVPEPTTGAIALLAVASLGAWTRRRSR